MRNNLEKKAFKAGLWYTISNFIIKGCIFITLPIFARILTPSDFGIYNTYMAYELIITAIIGLGFYGTIKNAKLDFGRNFNEYISSILSMNIFLFILCIIFVNVFKNELFYFTGFNSVILNLLIIQSFGSYLVLLFGCKLNIEFKYKSYILISFFNTITNIVMSLIMIFYIFPNQRYLGRIIGTCFPYIIIGIIILLYIYTCGRKIFSLKYWKYALVLGLPLVPHAISQSLLTQLDRIMITNMVSSYYSGIYSFIYTISTVLTVIVTSLDNAWTPYVFLKIKNKDYKSIKKISKEIVKLMIIMCIGFICICPELIKIIGSDSYLEGLELIIPLTIANYFIFMYSFPVGIEYYYKKTKYIAFGTVLSAIFNLLLNFIGIKIFGYKAAAYTTMISYLLLFVFHLILSKKLNFEECYEINYLIKSIIFLTTISIVIFIISLFPLASFIIRYVIVIIILIYLYLNKDKYIKLLKKG